MKVPPKINAGIHDVVEYCKNLEKLLKKAVNNIGKNMVPIEEYKEAEKKCEEAKRDYDQLFREQKDYKCELNVLESRLEEAEKKELKLMR